MSSSTPYYPQSMIAYTKFAQVKKVTMFMAAFSFFFFFAVNVQAAYKGYGGELVGLSHQNIRIAESAGLTIEVRFKNTSTETWRRSGSSFLSINVSEPFNHESEMAHVFWENKYQPSRLLEASVSPGEIGTFRFALAAPKVPGVYTEHFMLSAEGIAWLRSTEFPITMIVGDVPPEVLGATDEQTLEEKILSEVVPPETLTSTTIITEVLSSTLIMVEPTIRVGLYKTIDPVIVTADTDFWLENPDGTHGLTLPAGHKAVTYFDPLSKSFFVNAAGYTATLPYAKFVPTETSTIFTITNYVNPSKWQEGVQDNRFRGSIEIQYGQRSESPWVVNEILLEDYLKGIKETSQVSPAEYHKAIAVAARTYAIWHLFDGKKHASNNFTLDAVYDQVYRGVNTEKLISSFSDAVDATHGIAVTYGDDIAFTPYFAQSDGRTRTIREVWGGANMPHLQSVADPTNDGLRLWGHGVGMSARGALIMASRYGSTFKNILNHYYTGVGISEVYVRGVDPLAELKDN